MPGQEWVPPASDRSLGVGFYATHVPPVPGTLKESASDFVVREISLYPMPAADGPYTVLRVQSENWEQHELAERIAQQLGLGPRAVSWAGTKDRRARSERLFSYRGVPPRGPGVALPDVEVVDAYRARDGLVLGHHFGNSFSIRVSGVEDNDRAVPAFEMVRDELKELGGFPNWFGPQRFGEVRPVTHLVGRELVGGRPEEAVRAYLEFVPEGGPDGEGDRARRAYARTRDPVQALREFPPSFRFERVLLDHLARGQPAERALRALSRPLRSLFVHAYQSWLFNRWLTLRWESGLSMTVPEPGDYLLRITRDGTVPGVGPIPVAVDNLEESRDLASRGRALVSGPLVGFETPPLGGPGGELLERVLAEEKVERRDFQIPGAPELASRGSWRPLLTPAPPIAITSESFDRSGVWFHFSLPKGAYATMLMREFLKTGAQSNGRY